MVNKPDTILAHIMSPDVISVGPLEDQEEVARFVARYDLLAVPVVDNQRRLLGVVTVDDVIDVIRDEAEEDMMLMAGMGDDVDFVRAPVLTQAWHRAGWLLATIVGGILMSEIIGTYEHTLATVAVLAGFIPVVMGMGGNVGIQSGTIAVRGLATGSVQLTGTMAFIAREAQVGLILGVLYAALLGIYTVLRYWADGPLVGLSVAISVLLAIILATIFGSAIPVFLHRLGVDPAVATGPFVTTGVDILAILVYFNVARALLGL